MRSKNHNPTRVTASWIIMLGLLMLVASCSSMRKDRFGTKHVKLKNGIYL